MLELNPAERDALQAARLAVFEGKIICDARPPVDDLTLAKIARRCAGPLPDDLVQLWRTSFGGVLAYDTRVAFGEQTQALSFRELFYPESNRYRDLWGWIEYESEIAERVARERGRAWSGRLDAIPFGGFEYLERVYAIVAAGPRHGTVMAWSQGLPPAWNFNLHEDGVTTVAPSVRETFRRLALEKDPFQAGETTTGTELLEAVDVLDGLGTAGRTAAVRMRALVRDAVLDWRAAVGSGTIAQQTLLCQLALEHAARTDDVELLVRLEALGCSLVDLLSGGGSPLAHAFWAGSLRVARFLLDRRVPVKGALRAGARFIDAEMARELLARGDTCDEHSVFGAIDAGHVETGMVLLDGLPEGSASLQLAIRARERAADAEELAGQIERGEVGSNMTAGTMRERAARLREIADRVAPIAGPRFLR